MITLISAALQFTGCGRVTDTTRDNRRLMDAVLTAVVIRSNAELSNDKKLVEARHSSGKLSAKTHGALLAVITKAEAGDWTAAEQQLYEFRKQSPFPK